MPKDYLSNKDGELLAWLSNFGSYIDTNHVALGITAAQVAVITDARDVFDNAYLALLPAQAAAQAARAVRDETKTDVKTKVRALVKILQASPLVSDEEREAMKINVKKAPAPIPTPTTKPVGEIEEIEGLQHVIKLLDSGTGKAARPDGVSGAEVFMTISNTPPTSPDSMPLTAFATKSKFTQTFSGGDVGKFAFYSFRWFTQTGERGPWSSIVAATIAA